MRYVITLLLCVLAMPLAAGTVNVANGRGSWKSSSCVRPVAPAYIGLGGETPATGMNAASISFNRLVQDTQAYLDCITEEARRDSKAAGEIIMMSLDAESRAAQEEVNRARGQLYGR